MDITNPYWRCGYFAIAFAISLIFGIWAFEIHNVTPKPKGWVFAHQVWLNFLCAFAGWLAGWVVVNRWLACPSFMCADEPKFATAVVALVALIGMTGLLPVTIVNGIRGLENALGRWLGGK